MYRSAVKALINCFLVLIRRRLNIFVFSILVFLIFRKFGIKEFEQWILEMLSKFLSGSLLL